jgi:predicted molibdopterin-dependent oxidoreductase YjgC
LNVEDGRLLGSHPSSSHPVAEGSLCMRGWNCVEAPYDKGRLTTARVRVGGSLMPVTAEAAIEEIANRLNRLRGAAPPTARTSSRPVRGRRQVLFVLGPVVANEDLIAAKRLAKFLDADACSAEIAGAPVARSALQAVLGKGYSARTLDVVAGADVIWLFGVDDDNYPQVASRLVRARRKGAVLVRFDIKTSSSRPGLTTISIPPGRSALVPLLLQKAAFDLDVVPPRLRNVPQFSSLAKPFVPGRGPFVPDHGWLPDEQARELLRAFVAARSPAVVVGDRWLSSIDGEVQTIQLLQALALIGSEERVVMATGEANSWGSADLLRLPPHVGSPLLDLIDPEGPDSIRAVFIVGDDLMRRTPRPAALARKLSAVETVVVIDRFETECVPFAHVVLPSVVFAELDGSVTNSLGMVQRWRKVVAPPGDARPEREWFEEVGRRIGMNDWPAAAAEWLRAIASENPAYRPESIGRLYGDCPALAVSLEESARITFVEPSVPPVAPRAADYPLALHFRAHPASWSTGVLSEREQLLKREVNESTVSLSPGDSQQAGVKDGSAARVATPYDEAVLTVRTDPSLPDGVSLVTALPGSQAARLRGFRPDSDRRTVGTEPVPGRIEKV